MAQRVQPFVTAGEALVAEMARREISDLQEPQPMPKSDTGKPRARRGFAAMNPDRRREIARKGGASVNPANRSFAKDRDLAASAGRKGGEASRGGGRQAARV